MAVTHTWLRVLALAESSRYAYGESLEVRFREPRGSDVTKWTVAGLALPLIAVISGATDFTHASEQAPSHAIASSAEYSEEDAARDFAASANISLEDARTALSHTGPITDWVVDNWYSDDAGSVWVSYDRGYQVHARVPDGGSEDWVALLEHSLGYPISRHHGGATMGALNRTADYLFEIESRVLYDLNVNEGFLDLAESVAIPADVIDPRYVRITDQSDNIATDASASAGHIWDNWNGTYYVPGCTVGYTASTGSLHYVMTAAHCTDGWHQARSWTALHGETTSASNYSESCTSGDRQWQRVDAPVDHLLFDNYLGYYQSIQGVAGGWYAGQPAIMSGRVSGVDWGNIQFTGSPWGNYGLPPGPSADDCSATGISTTGIRVENIAADPGDSGGPILLYYNGSFYLAAITSTNTSTTVFGPWVPYLPVPTGAHICVAVNPC